MLTLVDDLDVRALGRLRRLRRNAERALRADRRRLGRVGALIERHDRVRSRTVYTKAGGLVGVGLLTPGLDEPGA